MLARDSWPGFLRDSVAYFGVSVLAYGLVFGLMFLFVDVFGLNRRLAFFFTYLIAYIFDYIANCRAVFRREHSHHRLLGYIAYLAVFFGLANALFHVLGYLGVHYLLETFLTLVILFPLRFVALRYVVFR